MELLIGLVELFCFFMGAQIEINEVDVPIIMYHHIVDAEEPLNDFTVSSTKFDSDMNALKENGYTAISYEELYDFVYNNGELPDKPIIITFDDGYESNYKYAYPTLKNLNMKATISIIVSMVGKDTYKGRQAFKHFSYDDAKEMYDSGLIDIQTHTYSLHDLSTRIGVKRNKNEDEFEYIYTIKMI